jgi:hypothetical protein
LPPSPISALLRAETRRYIDLSDRETDQKKKLSLASTALMLAQLAESHDRIGALPDKIIAQLDGDARLLAESIVNGNTPRVHKLDLTGL